MATSSPQDGEDQTGRRADRPWTAFFTAVNLSNLASAVALVTSLYTLLFLINPSLKPPEQLGATIAKVQMEHSVTLQRFMAITGTVKNPFDVAPETPGVMLFIQIDVQGFKKRTYGSYLSVPDYEALTEAMYPGQTAGQRISVVKSQAFSPAARVDRFVTRAWVAYPPTNRFLIVRMRLYDMGNIPTGTLVIDEPSSGLLDVVDTKPFRAVNPRQIFP